MVDVVRSTAAEADLRAILEYGFERWGIDDALAFVLSFEGVDELLAAFPEIGRPRSELLPEIRSWLHRGYVIFYRFDGRRIVIVRILHGAAEPAHLFDPWEE